MKTFLRCLIAFLLSCGASASFAAYNCSLVLTSIVASYDAASDTDVTMTNGGTINCTRDASDNHSMTYRVFLNSGLYSSGAQLRAQLIPSAGTYLNYNMCTNTKCNATNWLSPSTGDGNTIHASIDFHSALTVSDSFNYAIRVPKNQASAPAGLYADTLTASACYGYTNKDTVCGSASNAGFLTTGVSFDVSISIGNKCAFATSPNNITLNYISFGGIQTASSNFTMRCTNLLPYTLAVDNTPNTLLGLTYNLTLDASSATGTGFDQARVITATMAGGQSGTCASSLCTATQAHAVTVTY